MHGRLTALPGALLAASLLLGSCVDAPSDAYVIENDPGKVEFADGSDVGRVTLSDGTEERLGVETTAVVRQGRHLVVPDAAILVDPDGGWWVYTTPEPGVYLRHSITLDSQRDGVALLSSGPRPGTEVVTVGVAELYGVEADLGH